MTATIPKFTFRKGSTPLLVSMPHAGVHIPPDIAANMTDAALKLPDTDWHLEQLYDFLQGLGASVLVATHSRYVIDFNRPTDNVSLYPGQDTTGLCPTDTFRKEPVYRPGNTPDEAEVQRRIDSYWMPYHATLAEKLQRMRTEYGIAMLWDAHSIRSAVPHFFEGRLPDFNIGTASGASCNTQLSQQLLALGEAEPGYSAVLNGRFKGGYITRRYGNPANNIHAVQLELAQATYMQEDYPYRFDDTLASAVRPSLRRMIEATLDYAKANAV